MRGNNYTNEIKERARTLRAEGVSYKKISDALGGIPKSTLSTWLGKQYPGVFTREKQLEHLRRIQKLGATARRKQREDRIQATDEKMSEEVLTYPIHTVGFKKSILASLYWAEGSKSKGTGGLTFTNTDPKLMLLFVTLLRDVYPINLEKVRVRVHIHHYHNQEKVLGFWSKTLSVPLERFGKIHIKKRSVNKKFRRNFVGICFFHYGDGKIREELMALAYQLEKVYSNACTVPVV